jgi:hypothetical protein
MLIPDHVPVSPNNLEGLQSFAFCYGYIRWLIQALGGGMEKPPPMVGGEGSSRRSVLSPDFSAYCVHGGNQTCAEQQETGWLRCHLSDLAFNLTTREGGAVNVGI